MMRGIGRGLAVGPQREIYVLSLRESVLLGCHENGVE